MTLQQLQTEILSKPYVDKIAYYKIVDRGANPDTFQFAIYDVGILLNSLDGNDSRRFIKIRIYEKEGQAFYNEGQHIDNYNPLNTTLLDSVESYLDTQVSSIGALKGYSDVNVFEQSTSATAKVYVLENGNITVKDFYLYLDDQGQVTFTEIATV